MLPKEKVPKIQDSSFHALFKKIKEQNVSSHEITFEGFVTAPKYSCDSTINRKMTSYEALTSSDVLISHSDSRLDNFIRLLLNGPLESH